MIYRQAPVQQLLRCEHLVALGEQLPVRPGPVMDLVQIALGARQIARLGSLVLKGALTDTFGGNILCMNQSANPVKGRPGGFFCPNPR